MLEKFWFAQQPRIKKLLAQQAEGNPPIPFSGIRPSLALALRENGPGAIIAEYKRASPSRGDINLGASPEDTAADYAKAGAAALSVLTEERYFKGNVDFLTSMAGPGLPMLRKDFLLHPAQVAETAATPASALLLIVRMLGNDKLEDMLEAASRSGLECVLEVFDQADLDRARSALAATGTSPSIIQVNNRDLHTLTIDEGVSRKLIRLRRPEEVWISASGAQRREQVEERAALGFDAVLIGSALMSGTSPGAILSAITGKRDNRRMPS